MSDPIKGKVALITGSASGIGLSFAEELLRNGLKGLTVADVDVEKGLEVVENLENEFGSNKVIFVKTDVTKKSDIEGAFKQTIETFKNLDIVINNAGVLNDSIWEKEIAINFNGVVIGSLLAIDNYLPKHRSGPEGIIVNTASVAGLCGIGGVPIYSGTKHAVIGFGMSLGKEGHYKATKVRVLTICPGFTNTPLMLEAVGRDLGPRYTELAKVEYLQLPPQGPEWLGKALIKVIREGKSGSIWVAEAEEPAYEIAIPPWSVMRVK